MSRASNSAKVYSVRCGSIADGAGPSEVVQYGEPFWLDGAHQLTGKDEFLREARRRISEEGGTASWLTNRSACCRLRRCEKSEYWIIRYDWDTNHDQNLSLHGGSAFGALFIHPWYGISCDSHILAWGCMNGFAVLSSIAALQHCSIYRMPSFIKHNVKTILHGFTNLTYIVHVSNYWQSSLHLCFTSENSP